MSFFPWRKVLTRYLGSINLVGENPDVTGEMLPVTIDNTGNLNVNISNTTPIPVTEINPLILMVEDSLPVSMPGESVEWSFAGVISPHAPMGIYEIYIALAINPTDPANFEEFHFSSYNPDFADYVNKNIRIMNTEITNDGVFTYFDFKGENLLTKGKLNDMNLIGNGFKIGGKFSGVLGSSFIVNYKLYVRRLDTSL
jgi:hypothetical protein